MYFPFVVWIHAGFRTCQVFLTRSKWRHGGKWWMLFMLRVLLYSVNCGMLAELLIKVLSFLSLQIYRWPWFDIWRYNSVDCAPTLLEKGFLLSWFSIRVLTMPRFVRAYVRLIKLGWCLKLNAIIFLVFCPMVNLTFYLLCSQCFSLVELLRFHPRTSQYQTDGGCFYQTGVTRFTRNHVN